jgi:hypothetical protein
MSDVIVEVTELARGPRGFSTYEQAVAAGFEGSEAEYVQQLALAAVSGATVPPLAQQVADDRTAVAGHRVAVEGVAEQVAEDRTAVVGHRVAVEEAAEQAAEDRLQTGLDRTATGSDRVATGQDKNATAADRLATGQDRAATAASVAGVSAAMAAEEIASGPASYLKTLNPATHPTVYRSDVGREGWYTWDPNYSWQRIHADPEGDRAFTNLPQPNNGAWVRSALSPKERDAINAAYRRVWEQWPTDPADTPFDRAPILGRQINFNSSSENLADPHYAKDVTLQPETTTHRGIKLQRVTGVGFSNGLRDLRNADYPLEAGKLYVASAYVAAPRPVLDQNGLAEPNTFMWMQPVANSSSFGHGAKLLLPTPRRVWTVVKAGDAPNTTRAVMDPRLPWSGQAESAQQLRWLFGGFGHGGAVGVPELWIGGMQLELAPDQNEKVGIVTLGTSIDTSGAGSGDGTGHWTQGRGWSRWLEGLLCAPIFPASIGGTTTTQIDARFDTDVAPLREHAKYLVICAPVNDFFSSFVSATYRANLASIYAKALAAGWSADEIIWMTIQPRSAYDYSGGIGAWEAENAYIKATYRNVIDRGEAMRDAIDQGLLPIDFETDGIHQRGPAQRALAFMIYNKYRHFFRFQNVPGRYQRTVNSDAKAQSFGEPLYDTLKGAFRINAGGSNLSLYRDNDYASAPIVIFEGAAGSDNRAWQFPGPKYQRPLERVNTEILRQTFVNLTSDNRPLNVVYYQRNEADALSVLGSGFVIPPGTARTLCSDGTTVWTEQPALGASAGWFADTGTARKAANSTYTAGAQLTFSPTYVQAEMTAMAARLAAAETALQNASQTIKALKDAGLAGKNLTA